MQSKSPGSSLRGLLRKPVVPNTACQTNSIFWRQQAAVNHSFVSGLSEDGGVEPQWLMEPLTGLANRVQYPLATSSILRFAGPILGNSAVDIRDWRHVTTDKVSKFFPQRNDVADCSTF
jgi:hypothetical protein